MLLRKNFSFLFVFISLYACKGSGKGIDNDIPLFGNIDEARLSSDISETLNLLPDSAFPDLNKVRTYYSSTAYLPEWVYPESNICKLDTLLLHLSRSDEHGIQQQVLNVDTLALYTQKLKNNDLTYSEIAFLDIAANEAFLRYCKAMRFGLLTPKDILPNYYFETETADSSFVAQCFADKRTSINNLLSGIQPKNKQYKALQTERQKYLLLLDSAFAPIPFFKDKETIKPGDEHPYLPFIAKRLQISGELSANYPAIMNTKTLNHELLRAINRFRKKTGQNIDNEIGNSTIRALNYTFADYVNKIDINLERLRWSPLRPLGSKYIRVNVADMSLNAYSGDTIALNMKVCVGKAPDNKTPFLRSNIHQLVLNPTWSIPKSIVVKETSKLAARDSSYLRRHNIRVYRNGTEVHPQKTEWAKITEHYQPYTLVQDSGDINALGRIKFNFANKFSVYLHDTNSKSAFLRHNRALSHGCVRVQKPMELAFFCLPDYDKTNKQKKENRELLQDKIRYTTGKLPISKTGKVTLSETPDKMKTASIQLSQPIPILIDYLTCYYSPEGVIFRDDIYNMDSCILTNIRKKHPYNNLTSD